MRAWWERQPRPGPPAPIEPPAPDQRAVSAADTAAAYLAGQDITDPADVHGVARLWTVAEWADHTGLTLTEADRQQAVFVLLRRYLDSPTATGVSRP